MKTKLLTATLLLLTLTSCSSQSNFTYNWQIADGTLIINFANCKEFPEYSSSRAPKGNIKINCRQEYLDLIDILRSNETGYFHFKTIEIYLGVLNEYFLILDKNGCLWKISKAEALILSDKLSLPLWIANIKPCEEIICVCE